MTPGSVADMLQAGIACEHGLCIAPGGYAMSIRSNSPGLVERLSAYFAHVLSAGAPAQVEILAIECAVPRTGLNFIDWKREPGKTGRKDSYADIPGGRVVRKVRTGMVFLQSERLRIAAGPCMLHDNQVINFINSQYMNRLQHEGWLICHAAGLARAGSCLGIAGFSGGGKTTLMLNMLADADTATLTNDRLFVRAQDGRVLACGIPKLPRVNPGTIVHDPRLHGLIPREQREALLRLPAQQLWDLEQKYDVHIDSVYGSGRIVEQAPLAAMLVLNWQRDADERLSVRRVDLEQRRDLLAALMKSPGPFYQYPDGHFLADTDEPDERAYLALLRSVDVYEARGRIDFSAMARLCADGLPC